VSTGGLVAGVAKIAVLRANAIGDFLFTLPALEALRAAYPRAELVLLGAPWQERFLSGRPGPVDRVMVVPAQAGIRAPTSDDPGPDPEEFRAAARAERFDLALQLHGGGRNSNPLILSLHARLTAGLRAEDAPALDRWLRYVYHQPEVFRYLETVALVGAAPVTLTPRLATTAAEGVQARQALAGAGVTGTPLVALHPGATDPRRRWPARCFAALGDALADAGAQIIVTGDDSDEPLVREVVDRMRHPAAGLAGRLPLGCLAAAYEQCALVVGNDTGPLHLAAAVGTPTVGIYWTANLANCAPAWRARHRPLVSWTTWCPECGQDCLREPPCTHAVSLVDEVPLQAVHAAAVDLLDAADAPIRSSYRAG
jgi:ADP-heptose:LPS heptosyltransferase